MTCYSVDLQLPRSLIPRWLGKPFVAVLIGFLASSVTAEELAEISGSTMGTTYLVKAAGVGQTDKLRRRIDERLAEINAMMSTYLADSEVSRFNRAPHGEWFPVSPGTLAVVVRAQEISQRTSGAFDITVGPLVRLWNFGAEAEGTFSPPSDDAIRRTLAVVGYEKLETQRDPPALRKAVVGLEIDLSAIAKGYGVDQLAELLVAEKVSDFMVEIGGEVRVAGERPDGSSWRIGIESPVFNARRLQSVVALRDTALASSGDYRNFHEFQGRRYSHTIDPRTGRPVEHDLAAVSVVSAECAEADALATALLVLGATAGKRWAEEQEVAALFLSRTSDGVDSDQTRHFATHLTADTPGPQPARWSVTLLASALVFGIAVLAMSIGVLLGRARIKGSCGGLAGLTDEHGETLCQACSNPSPSCQGTPVADSQSANVGES